MRKIFIQNSTLYLAGKNGARKIIEGLQEEKKVFTVLEYKSKTDLQQHVSRLSVALKEDTVVMVHDSSITLEKLFFSGYKLINAAGGAVFSKEGQLLMIFRRGKWDLPKGKLDKGETIKNAAVREITEETGVEQLKIISPVKFLFQNQSCTFHTYEMNGKKILKATHWFKMTSSDRKKLVPQADEGIEKVEWCSKRKVQEYLKNSFHSIEEVVEEVLK
ncbi:MAG: NUDIX domain-containing protein [Chitinophagales bacterium]